MIKKKNLFIWGLFIVAICVSSSYAGLLGVRPGFPLLIYNGGSGTLNYTAATGTLSVNSDPLAIRFSPTTWPQFVMPHEGIKSVTIDIELDSSGGLVGGVTGDDLVITGEVDQDGDGTADYVGTLLTGEIAQFGFLDSGGPTDQFDFRFTVTGGELAGFYIVKDIGIIINSEASTFTGDFTVDFTGGAKGIVGPIDSVCTLDVAVEGCVVVPPPPPSGSDCEGKLISMVLEYTGLGCDASSHQQMPVKVKCSGDPALAEPVTILVTNRGGKKVYASQTGVNIGDTILVEGAHGNAKRKGKGAEADEKKFIAPNVKVTVLDANGNIIQVVKFNTSCQQPLNVGNQFGSLKVTSIISTRGGQIDLQDPCDTCITELPSVGTYDVEYTYTVINNSAVYSVMDVSVIDDIFGIIPGSPIASIPPDSSVTLTLTAPVGQETTNTATASGLIGGVLQCDAAASATITEADEPNDPCPDCVDECTTKIKAMLLMYTGPDIADATVTLVSHAFPSSPVVYPNISLLTSGMVLSKPMENGFTIDGTAHNSTDLGPNVSISINGDEEIIHTSCSTPFVSGAPAPLNDPKGDPSPNWFVVQFTEK